MVTFLQQRDAEKMNWRCVQNIRDFIFMSVLYLRDCNNTLPRETMRASSPSHKLLQSFFPNLFSPKSENHRLKHPRILKAIYKSADGPGNKHLPEFSWLDYYIKSRTRKDPVRLLAT